MMITTSLELIGVLLPAATARGMASQLTSAAIAQLWQVTLVILVVALVARVCCRRRPHLAYLLWMLVVVKALTPPLVSSRAGVFSWLLRTEAPQAAAPAAARAPAARPALPPFTPPPQFVDDERPAAPQPAAPPAPPRSIFFRLAPRDATTAAWFVAGATWLAGLAGLGTYAVYKWIGFRRRWSASAVPAPANLVRRVEELAVQLGLRPSVRRRLRVVVSHAADSPAVFGLWRPTLLLPAHLIENGNMSGAVNHSGAAEQVAMKTLSLDGRGLGEGEAPHTEHSSHSSNPPRSARVPGVEGVDGAAGVAEPPAQRPGGGLSADSSHPPGSAIAADPLASPHLDAILAHELVHIRRGDPAAALVQLAAQLAWWFHPLVWWANREARRERERACDEEVVAGLGCRPGDYARALLDVLERQARPQPAFAVPGVGMLGVTARRLEHLLSRGARFHRRTPRWNYAILLAALALVLPGAGLQIAAAPNDKDASAAATTESTQGAEAAVQGTAAQTLSLDGRGQGEGEAPPAANDGGAKKTSQANRAASPAESKALERLRALGASVHDEPDRAGKRHLSIGLDERWKGTDEDLASLAEIPSVQSLHWGFPGPSPKVLAGLRFAEPIQHLTLQDVTDDVLAELPRLPACQNLIISSSSLSDAGAKRLAELAVNVESLMIAGNELQLRNGITDAGIAHIGALKGLKRLDLYYLAITDAGLKPLAGLNKLETLMVAQCPDVTGRGLSDLAGLAELHTLSISGSGIEAASLRAISQLPHLQILNVGLGENQKPKPTDIEPLAKLISLRRLSLVRSVSLQQNAPVPHAAEDVALGDAILRVAGKLPDLQSLNLFAITTSDAGLQELVATRHLRNLALEPVFVTDAGLAAAGSIESLRQLSLEGEASYTDVGFTNLARATRLTHLSLPGTNVTDEMVAGLAPLTELKSLILPQSKITGQGLAALKGSGRLRTLNVAMSPFDDAGSRNLSSFQLLENLDLSNTKITDQALANIGKLTRLRTLSLNSTEITGAGLAELHGLKQLRDLRLGETKVTDAGKDAIEAAVPGLHLARGRFVLSGTLLVFPADDDDEDAAAPQDDASKESTGKPLSLDEKGQDKAPPEAGQAGPETPAGEKPKPVTPRQFKATGTFVPEGAKLRPDPDPQPAQPRDPNEPAAAQRLRDLGAIVEIMSYDGDPPGKAWWVVIRAGWKGTDADLALINELPDIASLFFDPTVCGAGIGAVKLAAPADHLTLSPVTDESTAAITGLPACRDLTLAGVALSPAGCERVARFAAGADSLRLQGQMDPQNRKAPPRGIDDAGLAHFGQIKSLKRLEMVHLGITDAGLAGLAGLERLERINVVVCPEVRGQGIAALALLPRLQDLSAYMMPLTSEGLQALSQLAQVKHLHWQLDEGSAAKLSSDDAASLAKMSQLEYLALVDPQSPQELLPYLPFGNAILRAARQMPALRGVELNGIAASAEGIAALADAPALDSLHLSPVELGDRSLQALGQLKSLKRLGITGKGEITAAGLAKLAPLTQLKSLSIDGGALTDDTIKQLPPLAALEGLSLPGSQITGTGLSALAGLPKLRSLSLVRSRLDDAGSGALPALRALEELDLSETKITDAALAPIARLAKLRSLSINNTAISVDGLAALRALKNLRELHAEGLKATPAELATLRAALPGVEIEVRGRGWDYVAKPDAKADDKNKDAAATQDDAPKDATGKPLSLDGRGQGEGEAKGGEPYKLEDGTKDTPPNNKGVFGNIDPEQTKGKNGGVKLFKAYEIELEQWNRLVGTHPITIRGRATDAAGKPIAGANIHVVSLEGAPNEQIGTATTDADGGYEIRDAKLPIRGADLQRQHGKFQVFGTATGHGVVWQGVCEFRPVERAKAPVNINPAGARPVVYADEPLVADLQFGDETALRGRLVDESDRPIRGAKITLIKCQRFDSKPNQQDASLYNPADTISATSDAEGRFIVAGLAKETSALIEIKHPDFGQRGYEVALTDAPNPQSPIGGRKLLTGDLNLQMAHARQVSLKFLIGDAPAAEAMVAAGVLQGGFVDFRASGKTDKAGTMTAMLAPGEYILTVRPDRATAPAAYLETKLPLTVEQTPQKQSRELHIPAGCTLEIEAVDADSGAALPNVAIATKMNPFEDESDTMYAIIGHTDAEGKFRKLVSAGKGRYTVVASNGYTIVDDRDEPIELPAGKTTKLQFKLRKKEVVEGQKPAADAQGKTAPPPTGKSLSRDGKGQGDSAVPRSANSSGGDRPD